MKDKYSDRLKLNDMVFIMYRSVRHPIEAFRTSPVQAVALLGSLATIIGTSYALEFDNAPVSALDWGVAAVNAGSVAVYAVLIKHNITLRDQLESTLKENGFNDRIMSKTTHVYCARQVARVACENTGYLENYVTLCEQNSTSNIDTWLPHI